MTETRKVCSGSRKAECRDDAEVRTPSGILQPRPVEPLMLCATETSV